MWSEIGGDSMRKVAKVKKLEAVPSADFADVGKLSIMATYFNWIREANLRKELARGPGCSE